MIINENARVSECFYSQFVDLLERRIECHKFTSATLHNTLEHEQPTITEWCDARAWLEWRNALRACVRDNGIAIVRYLTSDSADVDHEIIEHVIIVAGEF